MIENKRDIGLDALLDLDGQIFVIEAECWVKFVVQKVQASDDRPHGLEYSLTLHDASGERLVGFDNAHVVKGNKGVERDHKHRLRNIRPYAYKDAASLLADFWAEVDKVLKEKGVIK
jgi:hypothetical protein